MGWVKSVDFLCLISPATQTVGFSYFEPEFNMSKSSKVYETTNSSWKNRKTANIIGKTLV